MEKRHLQGLNFPREQPLQRRNAPVQAITLRLQASPTHPPNRAWRFQAVLKLPSPDHHLLIPAASPIRFSASCGETSSSRMPCHITYSSWKLPLVPHIAPATMPETRFKSTDFCQQPGTRCAERASIFFFKKGILVVMYKPLMRETLGWKRHSDA